MEGLTYGKFMHGLKLAGVELDRKVLADIDVHEAEAFKAIVAQANKALASACALKRHRPQIMRGAVGRKACRALFVRDKQWRGRVRHPNSSILTARAQNRTS